MTFECVSQMLCCAMYRSQTFSFLAWTGCPVGQSSCTKFLHVLQHAESMSLYRDKIPRCSKSPRFASTSSNLSDVQSLENWVNMFCLVLLQHAVDRVCTWFELDLHAAQDLRALLADAPAPFCCQLDGRLLLDPIWDIWAPDLAVSMLSQAVYRCTTDVYNILNMLSLSIFILV